MWASTLWFQGEAQFVRNREVYPVTVQLTFTSKSCFFLKEMGLGESLNAIIQAQRESQALTIAIIGTLSIWKTGHVPRATWVVNSKAQTQHNLSCHIPGRHTGENLGQGQRTKRLKSATCSFSVTTQSSLGGMERTKKGFGDATRF